MIPEPRRGALADAGGGSEPFVVEVKGKGKSFKHLKVQAAVGLAGHMWRRRATRITPVLMVLAWFPGVQLAMYLVSPWATAVVGVCLTWLVWLTQRQVRDGMVDRSTEERRAAQWAWRTSVVPAAGALFFMYCRAARALQLDVWELRVLGRTILGGLGWTTLLLYFVGCVTLWTFLFMADRVGMLRLREQIRKVWLYRAAGTAYEGTRVKSRKRTEHGEEIVLDASRSPSTPAELVKPEAKESLAVKHQIPVARVQAHRNSRNAAEVVVRIDHTNPWAKEIAHPLHPTYLAADGEPGSRSIFDPIPIGVDPTEHDERKRVITKTLYSQEGGQHILVIAGTGGGKTTVVNNVVEHVSDCHDANVTMMDVTKAIHADAWQSACRRVHCGPDSRLAVVQELEAGVALIDARSASRRGSLVKQETFQPTGENRVEVYVLDEADQVLADGPPNLRARAQAAVKYVLSKGRSEGVILIVIAQRGTLDYLGKGDVQANSFTRIVLGISRTSEMLWAVPGWQERGIPDMSTFGEGAKGVFVLVEPQSFRTGRAFALYSAELIQAIAWDRCRPERVDALLRLFHRYADEGLDIPVLTGGRWHRQIAAGLPDAPPAPEPEPEVDGLARVPAYGTPPPAVDEPETGLDAALDRMAVAVDSAADRALLAAEQAQARGAVPLSALVAARASEDTTEARGVVVSPEVRRLALTLGRSERGFSRAWFREQALMIGAPQSDSWATKALAVLVADGDLEAIGRGPATRYRRRMRDTASPEAEASAYA